jgi:hypothetical protein
MEHNQIHVRAEFTIEEGKIEEYVFTLNSDSRKLSLKVNHLRASKSITEFMFLGMDQHKFVYSTFPQYSKQCKYMNSHC